MCAVLACLKKYLGFKIADVIENTGGSAWEPNPGIVF
jgi:hypothetical protein